MSQNEWSEPSSELEIVSAWLRVSSRLLRAPFGDVVVVEVVLFHQLPKLILTATIALLVH